MVRLAFLHEGFGQRLEVLDDALSGIADEVSTRVKQFLLRAQQIRATGQHDDARVGAVDFPGGDDRAGESR